MAALCDAPFMMLEKDARADAAELFERCGLSPSVRFTTWDDYAIMSMVESGLGISVLPELILKRCAYDIEIKSLEEPFIREMGIIMKDRERLPIAVKRLLKYLVKRQHIKCYELPVRCVKIKTRRVENT